MVQLIEATSKRYKALQGIGVAGMVIGLVAALSGAGVYAAGIMIVSLVIFATGRYQAWWHHR